tara:strand:- start:9301 stop:10260 length:960 start_codon:yes stop_codon:yes gene_type:complete
MDFKKYFGSKQNKQTGSSAERANVRLTTAEKFFINSTVFEEEFYEGQDDLLTYIVDEIPTISGHTRSKATIKYYIYDSKERQDNIPRPYQIVFNTKRYSDKFKTRVLKEIRRHGRVEVTKRFAVPSGTISGWMDSTSTYRDPSNTTSSAGNHDQSSVDTGTEDTNGLLKTIKRLGNMTKKKGKRNITPLERRGIHAMVKEIGERATAERLGFQVSTVRNTVNIVEEALRINRAEKKAVTAEPETVTPTPEEETTTPSGTSGIDYVAFITNCEYLVNYYTELAEMAEKVEKIEENRDTAKTYADKIRIEVEQLKKNLTSL